MFKLNKRLAFLKFRFVWKTV